MVVCLPWPQEYAATWKWCFPSFREEELCSEVLDSSSMLVYHLKLRREFCYNFLTSPSVVFSSWRLCTWTRPSWCWYSCSAHRHVERDSSVPKSTFLLLFFLTPIFFLDSKAVLLYFPWWKVWDDSFPLFASSIPYSYTSSFCSLLCNVL